MLDEAFTVDRSITFADDFTFKTIMEKDERICAGVVARVLEQKVDHIVYKQIEKELQTSYSAHGIRMDVFLADAKGTVVDVEMQKRRKGDILRRLRYYQAAVDVTLLDKSADYAYMPESYLIMLCATFDPLALGYMRYEAQMACVRPVIHPIDDGRHLILCNAQGTEAEESKEFIRLMRYIGNNKLTEEEFADDPLIAAIEDRIEELKHDDEWRAARMKYECDMMDSRREGMAEGKVETRAETQAALNQLAVALKNAGRSSELTEAALNPSIFNKLCEEFGIKNPFNEVVGA